MDLYPASARRTNTTPRPSVSKVWAVWLVMHMSHEQILQNDKGNSESVTVVSIHRLAVSYSLIQASSLMWLIKQPMKWQFLYSIEDSREAAFDRKQNGAFNCETLFLYLVTATLWQAFHIKLFHCQTISSPPLAVDSVSRRHLWSNEAAEEQQLRAASLVQLNSKMSSSQ